jgi:hypothetical protein
VSPETQDFHRSAAVWRLGRAVILVALVAAVLAGVAPAHAQDLFSRVDLHLDAQYLTIDDPRFNWAFEFGADVDVVDWGRGRAIFRAEYEAIAGEQFRRFDVNQGNYLLEGAASFRLRNVELAAVWHHVSRHLSDRPKRFPIDWNMISGRIVSTWSEGDVALAWQTDVRATVKKAYVDYEWEVESAARIARPIASNYSVFGGGGFRFVGTDGSGGRGAQAGGRAEAGIRLRGRAAAAELFGAIERRIDPYPLEFATARWFLAGLRLTSMP